MAPLVWYTMAFTLRCDSCEFADSVDDEHTAYTRTRDHELEHGSHFVLIETEQKADLSG